MGARKKPSSPSARVVQQMSIKDLEPPSLPSSNESLSLPRVCVGRQGQTFTSPWQLLRLRVLQLYWRSLEEARES